MATSYSGRLLMPGTYGVPALLDIAVQHARLPRFAGAHRCHLWSVAHHDIVCDEIYLTLLNGADAHPLRRYLLLHDGSETATGDVPSPWKVDEMRRLENRLLRRTYLHYVRSCPTEAEATALKHIDRLALEAEAHVVGPPHIESYAGLGRRQWLWQGRNLLPEVYELVERVRKGWPDANDAHDPEGSLVTELLGRMRASGLQREGLGEEVAPVPPRLRGRV